MQSHLAGPIGPQVVQEVCESMHKEQRLPLGAAKTAAAASAAAQKSAAIRI